MWVVQANTVRLAFLNLQLSDLQRGGNVFHVKFHTLNYLKHCWSQSLNVVSLREQDFIKCDAIPVIHSSEQWLPVVP